MRKAFLVILFNIFFLFKIIQGSAVIYAQTESLLEVIPSVGNTNSMKVNTNVSLLFKITSGINLLPGAKVCLEFPVFTNRGGIVEDYDPLWSEPQISNANTLGYTEFLNNKAGNTYTAEIKTNSISRSGYCVILKDGSLNIGEKLEIRYTGRTQKFTLPFRFRGVIIDNKGNQQTFYSSWINLQPEILYTFNCVMPSNISLGKPFSIKIVPVDHYFNPIFNFNGEVSLHPKGEIGGIPTKITFSTNDNGLKIIDNLTVDKEGFVSLDLESGEIRANCNYAYAESTPSLFRFFGDLHFHTEYGISENDAFLKADGNHYGNYAFGNDTYNAYSYAKNVSLLDFAAMTPHTGGGNENGNIIDDANWPYLYSLNLNQDLADKYYQSGIFTTFYGYEWGGENKPGGGHHVLLSLNRLHKQYRAKSFYIDEEGKMIKRTCLADNIQNGNCYEERSDLINQLERDGGDYYLIPHTMVWENSNHPIWETEETRIPVGEIYSFHNGRLDLSETGRTYFNELGKLDDSGQVVSWGWDFRTAWAKGIKVGVIASTDNHFGQPARIRGANYTTKGGGIAVIIAPSNNRNSLWQAIGKRNTYATTGKRLYLDFSADGNLMGTEYTISTTPSFQLKVAIPGGIKKVQLVKFDGRSDNRGYSDLLDLRDLPETYTAVINDANFEKDSFYYLVAEGNDGEAAWSSPIFIKKDTSLPCPKGSFGNLDCSLNGCIDTADYELFRQAFGKKLSELTVLPNHHTPDLYPDSNNQVDTADYEIFRRNFGTCN